MTEKIPKALLDVAGEPFLRHQLRDLARQGVTKVVLCVGYLGELIEAEFGNGSDLGLEIRYSPDGPQLLGTGGALRQALPLLGDAFFVLYGDSFLPIAYLPVERAFRRAGQPALMTVLRNDGQWDRCNVEYASDRLVEYNKRHPRGGMRHIDYGLGILSKDALSIRDAPGGFDLCDVYHQLSLDGRLTGFEVTERFYEIGSPQGLADTIAYFQKRPRA